MTNNMNVRQVNQEEEIDLGEILLVLLQKLWLIILIGVIGAAAGLAISTFLITPLYTSTTSVYILSRQNESTVTYSDTQLANQLSNDYEELVTSRYVLESVISQLHLEDDYEGLKGRVSVVNANDTRIIKISVTDPSPAEAKETADAIRDAASQHIKDVMDIEAVNLVDEANLPTVKSSPSRSRWTMMGGLIGALIVILIVVLQYLLDDSIKSSDDVEKYLGLSTLAMIPIMAETDAASSGKGRGAGAKNPKKNKPPKKHQPQGHRSAEAEEASEEPESLEIPDREE